MPTIRELTGAPEFAELRALFEIEWEEIGPFEGSDPKVNLPSPVGAFSKETLIGGLAFTQAPSPIEDKPSTWINALFVLPEFRGLGIAHQLVTYAQSLARRQSIEHLFVYTHLPALYEELGWVALQRSQNNTVLTYRNL